MTDHMPNDLSGKGQAPYFLQSNPCSVYPHYHNSGITVSAIKNTQVTMPKEIDV